MINYQPLILTDDQRVDADSIIKNSPSLEETSMSKRALSPSLDELNEYKEKIQHQEKEKEKIKRVKNIKFFTLLFLSHTFIYLLASPNSSREEIKPIINDKIDFKILAKSYALPSNQKNEIKVDLYNEKKELLLENIDLINTIETNSNEDSSEQDIEVLSLKNNTHAIKHHLIRLGKDQARKLLPLLDQKFFLYPAGIKINSHPTRNVQKNFKAKIDPYQKQWEF